RAVARVKPRLAQALPRGFDNRGKAFLDPKPDIGRAGASLAQFGSGKCAKSRAAAGASTVYAKQQGFRVHYANSCKVPRKGTNAQERIRVAGVRMKMRAEVHPVQA